MKLLYRKSIAVVLGCLICQAAWAGGMPKVKPEKVGLSSERLERLTHAMQKGVEAGHFSGTVAAIARKGKDKGKWSAKGKEGDKAKWSGKGKKKVAAATKMKNLKGVWVVDDDY